MSDSAPMTAELGTEPGADRRHFEPFTTFYSRDDMSAALVQAYHLAAERAAKSALSAVRFGGLERLRKAQWDEAVTATLEQVLTMLPRSADGSPIEGGGNFYHPETPDFGDNQ